MSNEAKKLAREIYDHPFAEFDERAEAIAEYLDADGDDLREYESSLVDRVATAAIASGMAFDDVIRAIRTAAAAVKAQRN